MRISDWSSDVCSSDLDSTFVTIVNARQPGAGTLVANTWINRRVRVEADTLSAFGQLNWGPKIGRALCGERVGQYVSISVVAVSLKKNNTITLLYMRINTKSIL